MDKVSHSNSIHKFIAFYNKHANPQSTKKSKIIGILSAVAIISAYFIHDRFFKPPKHLRHLPYYGYFDLFKSIVIKGESLFDRAYRETVPMVNSGKKCTLYTEPGRYGWEVNISNAQDAKMILSKRDKYPKADIKRNKGTLQYNFLGGRNVALLEGHAWKNQRKVLNPAFHRSMPVNLFGTITQDLFGAMENTMEKTGEKIDMSNLIVRLTLDAIGRAAFGFNFESLTKLEDNEWLNVYNSVHEGMFSVGFSFFKVLDQKLLWLFPKRQEIHRNLKRLTDMLDRAIQDKREQVMGGNTQNDNLQENEKDLLTLMLESELRGEGALTNEELKSNINAIFFAGHDTTASSISSALYELAKRPDLQERARQEAIDVLGDEPVDVLPSLEDVKKLTFIDQIIKENLRLNNSITRLFSRKAMEDTVLSDGTLLPKDSHISINVFNIMHTEESWKDNKEFNPDRFSEGNAIDNAAWLPFGGGSHQCIGMKFSINEQRVVLSMMLRKFIWSLPKDSVHKNGMVTGGYLSVSPVEMTLNFQKRY